MLTRKNKSDAAPEQKIGPVVSSTELLEAKRRYQNARRRARYWSGTPTFRPFIRSTETRSSRLNEKYELAMCDCKNWEQTIQEMTGKVVPHYDPKKQFAAKFSILLASNNQAQRPPEQKG